MMYYNSDIRQIGLKFWFANHIITLGNFLHLYEFHFPFCKIVMIILVKCVVNQLDELMYKAFCTADKINGPKMLVPFLFNIQYKLHLKKITVYCSNFKLTSVFNCFSSIFITLNPIDMVSNYISHFKCIGIAN